MTEINGLLGLLRQKQVLKLIPISGATWWRGVREGRFPQPVKLGPKTTCWRADEIKALIDQLGVAPENGGSK